LALSSGFVITEDLNATGTSQEGLIHMGLEPWVWRHAWLGQASWARDPLPSESGHRSVERAISLHRSERRSHYQDRLK